ncbi:MAG: N-acetylmuramidase domain-containing protein [Pseudomonadota bacterium]
MTLPHEIVCPPENRWLAPERLEHFATRFNIKPALLRAVRRQEAQRGGFRPSGELTRRFEPHKMPERHWKRMGFQPPAGRAPWRHSLKDIAEWQRDSMEAIALSIDVELAYRATSWGALQEMGFNAEACGYASATAMVADFATGAEKHWSASLEKANGSGALDRLRAGDFVGFAELHNGPGRPEEYGAELAEKYRIESGEPAAEVLRRGSRGASVVELQRLLETGGFYEGDLDGVFGRLTFDAVKAFQADEGLHVDGVVGVNTWPALKALAQRNGVPTPRPKLQEEPLDAVASKAWDVVRKGGVGAVSGGGALFGFSQLSEVVQLAIIGTVAFAVLGIGAFLLWRLAIRPRRVARS